jgi:cold-inducible RNA-binding protein
VFVGSVAFQTSKDELVQLLSAAGNVVDVYLPTDRETGRPRGFAFVTFSTEAEAAEAIRRFHDHELNGRRLVVNEAEARPARRPGFTPRPSGPPPVPFDAGDRSFRQMSPKSKGSRRGLRRRKRSL